MRSKIGPVESDPKKIRIAGFWSDEADRKVSITVDGKTVAVMKDTVRDKGKEVAAYVAIVDFEDGKHDAVISGEVGSESSELKRPIEIPWKPRQPKTDSGPKLATEAHEVE